VRVLALAIRRGSGGAGRHAGGDGQRKHLRFLAPARVGWIADRATRGPWGLAGGSAGAPGRARLRRPGAQAAIELASRAALEVEAGSELELETPGGGGHGAAP
jgi:N-methylhydantoinase B/oxoprolinase/acetone carboxylase alpha subunit